MAVMSNMNYGKILDYYKGRNVLITGSTGFKGTWLSKILIDAKANVIGYALNPPTEPSLYSMLALEKHSNFCQVIGDVRNYDFLKDVFKKYKPNVVIHLAAQPIVRESYKDPITTYSTNVMGTVNVCECIRCVGETVESFLNVTTDKVYKNFEWEYGYREEDPLDGFDPYSNSKSCSELVTHSYKKSFFYDNSVPVSTARAGNVIGGGDFSPERIIPDCIRTVLVAAEQKKEETEIIVRNPKSVRPYQHVLDPLFGYLLICWRQAECPKKYTGYYNVGPSDTDCITTGDLVSAFCDKWNNIANIPLVSWKQKSGIDERYEAVFLKLDSSRIRQKLGWSPRWNIDDAIKKTVEFTKVISEHGNIEREIEKEIDEFMG